MEIAQSVREAWKSRWWVRLVCSKCGSREDDLLVSCCGNSNHPAGSRQVRCQVCRRYACVPPPWAPVQQQLPSHPQPPPPPPAARAALAMAFYDAVVARSPLPWEDKDLRGLQTRFHRARQIERSRWSAPSNGHHTIRADTGRDLGVTSYQVTQEECTCPDFPKAPHGWCKHRLYLWINDRAPTPVGA